MGRKKADAMALGDTKPTAEELAAARRILAGFTTDQKRSKQTALNSFLKRNIGAPGNQERLDAAPESKTGYLEEYLVHMSRQENARKNTTKKFSTTDVDKTQFHEWTRSQMEKELGEVYRKDITDTCTCERPETICPA